MLLMISRYDVMNPHISTESLMKAQKIESKLKFNTGSVVNRPSHEVIVNMIKWASVKTTPVNDITELANLLENGDYQNIAISDLVCHLFYLRMFRICFRLIRSKQLDIKDFKKLLMICGSIAGDFISVKNFRNHKARLTTYFDIKAKLTIMEMFDLQQINRYWKRHHARRNPHHLYRFWWNFR